MRNSGLVFFSTFFLALFIWSCSSSRNSVTDKSTPFPNTVLWEISSDDLETSSYLMGTIHLIPEAMYFWPDHFEKVYEATQQVVLETNELDMDPASMMAIMPKIMLPDGKSLEDFVSAESYQRIADYFDGLGLPLQFLKNIKPFFLYMLVDVDMTALFQEGLKSYELEISEKSKRDQKPILGLESMDFQISLFDSISYQDQAELLVQTVERKSRESSEDDHDEATIDLYQSYVNQDLNAILEEIQQTDVAFNRFNKLFLENRNRAWIPKIETFIRQKPSFIAVGAAHLPGEMGVIHLLEQAGYTLRPIITENGTH